MDVDWRINWPLRLHLVAALDKWRPKACGAVRCPCTLCPPVRFRGRSPIMLYRLAAPPFGSIPHPAIRRNKSRNGFCGAFEFPYEHAMVLPRYQYQASPFHLISLPQSGIPDTTDCPARLNCPRYCPTRRNPTLKTTEMRETAVDTCQLNTSRCISSNSSSASTALTLTDRARDSFTWLC